MSTDQTLILGASVCIGLIWLVAGVGIAVAVVRGWARVQRLSGGSGAWTVVWLVLGACLATFWLGFVVVLIAGLGTAFFAAGA